MAIDEALIIYFFIQQLLCIQYYLFNNYLSIVMSAGCFHECDFILSLQ
jgi:hypothetical protein